MFDGVTPLSVLDADTAHPGRKPQFASQFHPRWNISFYSGLGGGTGGAQPFYTRGAAPMALHGSAVFAPSVDGGWGVTLPTLGATGDYFGTLGDGSGFTYTPNFASGSFVVCCRPASNTPAGGTSDIIAFYGRPEQVNDYFLVIEARGNTNELRMGWASPGGAQPISDKPKRHCGRWAQRLWGGLECSRAERVGQWYKTG